MRVTHVVRQFPPSVGGLEEAVLRLCGTLQVRGIAVDVVTLDRIAQDPSAALPAVDGVDGIPVRRIPFRGSWRYPFAPSVLAHIGGADVVHVHGIDFFFDYLAATRPLHGKPLVASTHGGFFHTAFAQRLKRLYFHTATRTSALAYAVIAASSASDLALFRPIVAGGRLRLAANGVDTAKWAGLASERPQRHLLSIGRFALNKNLPALFPVLRRLRARHPAWRLTVAGQPGEVTATALRRAAQAHDVADAVVVVEKPSDAAIGAVVATASYIVSPSRHEGFGLSVVEGLSAGLVPVLSRIPPFLAFVAEVGVGSAVAFEDPDTAAAAIAQLHDTVTADPDRARAAAAATAGRYSWSSAADAFERCYAEAIAGRPDVGAHPVPRPSP